MSHRIFYSICRSHIYGDRMKLAASLPLPGGMSDMPGGMSDLPCFLVLVLVCRILSIELRQAVLDVSRVLVLVSC